MSYRESKDKRIPRSMSASQQSRPDILKSLSSNATSRNYLSITVDEEEEEEEEELTTSPVMKPNVLGPYNLAGNDGILEEAALEAQRQRDSEFLDIEASDLLTDSEDNLTDDELVRQARLDYKLRAWYRRPSLSMICTFLLLCIFTFGFSTTATLELLVSGSCTYVQDHIDYTLSCDSARVQQLSLTLQQWFGVCSGVLSLLVTGTLGKMSDIYGRKPILLYSIGCLLLGTFTNYIYLNPVISDFHPSAVVISNVIPSLGGSISVLIAIGNTYIVDVVEPHQLTQAMSRMIAFMYCGMGIAPLAASSLKKPAVDLLGISVTLGVFCLLFGFFVFPESRSRKLKAKSRKMSRSASVSSENSTSITVRIVHKLGLSQWIKLLSSLKLLWVTEYDSDGNLDITARIYVIVLVVMFVAVQICTTGITYVSVMYGTFQFHWDNRMMGWLLSCSMLSKAIVLMFINPWLNDNLNIRYEKNLNKIDSIDKANMFISLISESAAMIVMIFANSTPVFILSTVFAAFGALALPTLYTALLKYNKSPEKTGEFFGCLAFFSSVVSLVAPAVFLSLYSFTLEFNSTFIFQFALAVFLLNLVIVFLLRA